MGTKRTYRYSSPIPIHLGFTHHGGKRRELWGAYSKVERDLSTPCHVWMGAYNPQGFPIARTRYTTHFPRAMLLKGAGMHGRIEMVCGHKDCINLSHMSVEPWKSYLNGIRPKERDEKGRYTRF